MKGKYKKRQIPRRVLSRIKRRIDQCKSPFDKMLVRCNCELEELAIDLLRYGAPIPEIARLTTIDRDKLYDALQDMRKGCI